MDELMKEYPSEEELGKRLAISNDLIKLLQEGKARIIDRRPGKPVNGRRMVEIDIEFLDE